MRPPIPRQPANNPRDYLRRRRRPLFDRRQAAYESALDCRLIQIKVDIGGALQYARLKAVAPILRMLANTIEYDANVAQRE
jgi:hypothetical protein